MKILLTGAGMVATHASRSLVEAGHEVLLFSTTPRPDFVRRVVGVELPFVAGDVRDAAAVVAAVAAFGPDTVVHTAARIGMAAQADPYAGYEVNVGGTMNVAEAVRRSGVRRLVHASTLGVHDLSQPQTGPLAETFPVGAGERMYGATKVACEQLLLAHSRAHEYELAMLRLAGVYGYGHFSGGSGIGREIIGLVEAARDGRPGRLGIGMPDRYELVHAKDVARAIRGAVLAERLPYHAYNVGNGVLVDRDDVVAAMRHSVPDFRYEPDAERRPDTFPRLQPMDLARSRRDLGYQPAYDLAAGLKDLLAEVGRS
ncbi:MAG: NAD-dependent epimerase/dehydratase family protein [Candidatus Limnocylindria bacterium]